MSELDTLSSALTRFAGLTPEEFQWSKPFWHVRDYKKGAYYNEHQAVCKYLGFIVKGVFRSYVVDAKSGAEKNVFFYSTHQFVVTFKSFIQQIPCDYHTQALEDAQVLCIRLPDLLQLYQKSHSWERFGRLVAQEAFNVVIDRAESFLFKTPEERYLDLLQYHPDIFDTVPLYHIASYLGIQNPSLSRIRKRISGR